MSDLERSVISCPAECRGCDPSGPQVESGPFRGSSLAIHSLLTFLLPLALAVTGAWLAGHNPASQLTGGVLGLMAGMVIVRFYAAARSRSHRGEA